MFAHKMTGLVISLCLLCAGMAGCRSVLLQPDADSASGGDNFTNGIDPPGGQEVPLGAFHLGPAGGNIVIGPQHTTDTRLQGQLLSVPPGALMTDTVFSVSYALSIAEDGEIPAGPALRIEPADVVSSLPLSVSLPYQRERVHFDRQFLAVHNSLRQPLDNPMTRVVVSQRPVAQLSTNTLGIFQMVVTQPPKAGEIGGSCGMRNLDVLFVIDNSPSMADKQALLSSKLRSFSLQLMNSLAALRDRHPTDKSLSLHLGIISTDVGLGYTATGVGEVSLCTTNGDNGKLQADLCSNRPGIDKTLCGKACTTPVGLLGGASYISVDINKSGDVTSNLDIASGSTYVDIELAMIDAFSCRAFLGEKGCGREAPFESVRRALLPGNNPGFFRYNDPALAASSLLMLVFLTDEDDQSGSDLMHPENQFGYMTMPGVAGMPKVGDNFHLDFRGFGMSTFCDKDTLKDNYLTAGVKSNCVNDKSQTFLREVSDGPGNEDFFHDILGPKLKFNVLTAGIWTLGPLDFSSIFGDWPTMYKGLTPLPVELVDDPSLSCTPADSDCLYLKRAMCTGSTRTRVPQYRLSQFASVGAIGFRPLQTIQGDICDESDYEAVLDLLPTSLAPLGAKSCMD